MTTIPEFFGSNVFSRAVMKERLPKKVYAEVVNAMENGGQISMATADVVADAMKNWQWKRARPITATGSSL